MIYYSLFDKSLQLYNPPFVESSDQRAISAVRNLLLTSEGAIINKLKNDIILVRVGSFDEVNGVFCNSKSDIICLSDISLDFDVGGDANDSVS